MLTYAVNQRPLSVIHSLHDDLHLEPGRSYLFDLPNQGCLQVHGEKGVDYLQGQLTGDMRELIHHPMHPSALCSIQGRVLALLDVISYQEGLFLILPKDMITDTQAALSKAAAFSKVSFSVLESYRFFGYYSPKPMPSGSFFQYSIAPNCFIIMVETAHADAFAQSFIDTQCYRGELAWHYLQLQQHQVSIYPISRGLFLPHRLGLHTTGHISFNKGCYKGQEIIARMHYRSKPKHGLRLVTIKTRASLQSGQPLLAEESGREVGELLDYCPIGPDSYQVLASVLLDNESSTLIIQPDKAKLRWQCRRGMLELDLLLTPFAANHLDGLTLKQLIAFERLLESTDPDLYAWLMGSAHPTDKELVEIVNVIHAHPHV